MKATETRFFKFLQKSAQFIIPIYQRQYSWTHTQCEQLWRDIVHAGQTELEAHFIGSVVYVERGLYSHSDVPQLLIIDGQQRLTTTILLITALAREIQKRTDDEKKDIVEGTNAKKLKKYYLCNDAEEGGLFYKLLLTEVDQGALCDLIDGKEVEDQESPLRVIQNFLLFKQRLEKASNQELNEVYSGLQKLIIVDIALDRERDNPQLIFESLNSTGLDLSQADLIRNYVLMGLEPNHQKKLYKDYWLPMERNFGHGENRFIFNQFMRNYLTMKTGKTPREGDVYEEFKKFAKDSQSDLTEIVADVHQHAKFYVKFVKEEEIEPKLLEAFKDINAYKVDVAYPLMLQLYYDYDAKVLTLDEFVQCCRYIESYAFRRFVCGIPPNWLNKTFSSLGRLLKKEKYLESFKAEFLKTTGARRFPSNEEFKRSLETKDMYNVRNKAYWLRRLENFGRKERVIVEDYTIEHIMPQNENLSKAWQAELGDGWESVHETYLHTIGNLTLTGYNPELSDNPFTKKRDMKGGFSSSPLELNKSLAKLENWNEQQIKERTSLLSDQMLKVWVCPELEESVLASYRTVKKQKASYSIEDHQYIHTGASKELYQKFRAQVMALDDNLTEEFRKHYVAFKLDTNVVDVIPQASGLRLSLNCKFEDIHDPKNLCKDTTNIGRWGNGDVEIKVKKVEDLPYALELIQQVIEGDA